MLKKLQIEFIKNNHRWLATYMPRIGVGSWSLPGSRANEIEFGGTLDEIISNHFSRYSSPTHICRPTLTKALELLNQQPACILETGSSAWGSNSSLLFDAYVTKFGGNFESVDLRLEPSITLQKKCCHRTKLSCDDSVEFLRKWVKDNPERKIDLLYLDSWDVDWANPTPSALHGLAEFLAASPNLKHESLILIDDTPLDINYFSAAQKDLTNFKTHYLEKKFYPGKGSIVKELLKSIGRGKEVMHEYQLLWKL